MHKYNHCHCFDIFFSHFSRHLSVATHRPFRSYGIRQITASNIVDPRLVTVNKKHTADPNRHPSRHGCAYVMTSLSASLYTLEPYIAPLSRASCYIRHTARAVSRSHAPSLYYSFDNDYGRLSTRRLLRHPLVPARERVWQRFSRVSLEPRIELDRRRRARRGTRARISWE